jgi:Carboxypeptidase regulatory-like domain
MRPILAALVLLAASLDVARDRQTVAPPRDPASAPAPASAGTGIIRGRVVAADTAVPVRRALITISGGGLGRGPAASRTIYTDAQGRYELRNLPPGAYVVTARPSQYQGQYLSAVIPRTPAGDPQRVTVTANQVVEGYDFVLRRAGVIAGRLVDENGDPVSGVYVLANRVGDPPQSSSGPSQMSDEQGRYRIFGLTEGEYRVKARPTSSGDWMQPGEGQSLGFLETYYPGTQSREEAGRLRVRIGQETAAGDLQLTRIRAMRVSGIVYDSQGAPAGGGNRTMLGFSSRDGGGLGTGLDPQGRFSIREPQAPGTYLVTARRTDETSESTVEYGSVMITLVDKDVDDVVVSMKPTVNLEGSVVFEPATPSTLRIGSLSIGAQSKDRLGNQLSVRAAPVGSDLTFILRRIAGEWLLRPSGLGVSGWFLKSVVLANKDITDLPTEFKAEDSGRLQIVFTNRASELSGTVTDAEGAPVRSCRIVLFGEDKATWFGSSLRTRIGWPNRDGRFSLQGLRPGRYYLIALPPERQIDDQSVDAAILGALVREATALVLGDDEQRVVDLKLASKEGGL